MRTVRRTRRPAVPVGSPPSRPPDDDQGLRLLRALRASRQPRFPDPLVAEALKGTDDGHHTIRSGPLVWHVLDNVDAGLATDFIGWPFKIDAEADASGPALVQAVSLVLEAARERGCDAVAACDFEDELPHLGGLPLYR